MLRKKPATTAAAALTLSLGIAALATIFSLLNGIVLRPLPYTDPERLVLIRERSRDGREAPPALADVLEWRGHGKSVDAIAAIQRDKMILAGTESAEWITVRLVSADMFSLLGVRPSLGRIFQADESAVVLTDSLWERRFGRDPGVIGRTVSLHNRARTIIGVLPRDFRFFGPVDAFLPLEPRPNTAAAIVIGRLAPTATLHQARAELQSMHAARDHEVSVEKLQDALVRGPQQDLPILLCAAAFLLLIACANVAGLALATVTARRHEFALRASLGAARARIFRQVILENVLLALLAGGAGLCLANWAVAFIRKQVPSGVIPNPDALVVDARVLCFTLALCLLTGIVFGLTPAWRACRHNQRAARGQSSGNKVRSALVVAELAASLVLLAGASLTMRALASIQHRQTGVPPGQVLTMRVSLPPYRYKNPAQASEFFRQALEGAAALPSVQSAALASLLPYGGGFPTRQFEIVNGGPTASAVVIAVTDAFFPTLGLKLKRGRVFTARDGPSAIVNETLARRFLSGADPVGRRLRLEGDAVLEIVGTVPALIPSGKSDAEPPVVYVPYWQRPAPEATLLLVAPRDAIPGLRTAAPAIIRRIDNEQPITDLATLEQLQDRHMAVPRLLAGLVASIGAMALLLALIGTYGLMSHAVTERTLEFGIRAALGAAPSDLYRLVGTQGIRLSLAGLALGFAGAVALSRALRGLLFGIPVNDLPSIAAMAAGLLAGALAACYIPARRAARLDPAAALRAE